MSFLVLAQSILQIDLQLLDDVEIRVPYIEVKVLDLLILLGMLLGQESDSLVLFVLNPLDFLFSFAFFLLSQQQHLVLVTHLDFLGYTLVLFSYSSVLRIVSLYQ